jgi:hypothetical protein
MAIELSNIAFTNQADVIPASGVEDIVNTGIANTFAGNDEITGTGTEYNLIGEPTGDGTGFYNIGTGFYNIGTLNTADGNDIITGIHSPTDPYNSIGLDVKSYGILHEAGTIDTGNGNDIITGISEAKINGSFNNFGIDIRSNSTLDTGKGNDIITGRGLDFGIINFGTIHTDEGNDIITGIKGDGFFGCSLSNVGVINTGDGNDRITGITKGEDGILTTDTIDTGNGDDIITGIGTRFGIENYGTINTGNGDDSIIAEAGFDPLIGGDTSIGNYGTINTGNGNDSIISKGRLYNGGVIFLGEGNDSFIADGVFDGSGNVFLGNGQDDFKGFGSGNFYGGNGEDTLQLASGNYTIGISGATVNFTKGSTIMITFEFEKLIAGSTTYNFSSLTNGQTIFVA